MTQKGNAGNLAVVHMQWMIDKEGHAENVADVHLRCAPDKSFHQRTFYDGEHKTRESRVPERN